MQDIFTKSIRNKLAFTLFMVLALVCQKANAQQEPLYTQYMFNTVSVNPAYAGTRNAMNMLFISRLQWTGIDGAPKTHNFTMHTPLNNYKMGVGFSIVADSYGPVNNYYFNFNYAYRINLTEKITLSMGIKGGIYNYYVDLNSINVGDVDPSFGSNVEQKWQPNAGAGLYAYSDKWYAGFSVPKLIQTDIGSSSSSNNLSALKQHYFLMAGYVFDINEAFKIKPSFITKMVNGAPPSTDITGQVIYQDTYWLGVSYRVEDALAFIANIQLNKQLMVGYSYDYTLSNLNSYSNGSHEIIISYDFDGFLKNKVISPRYF